MHYEFLMQNDKKSCIQGLKSNITDNYSVSKIYAYERCHFCLLQVDGNEDANTTGVIFDMALIVLWCWQLSYLVTISPNVNIAERENNFLMLTSESRGPRGVHENSCGTWSLCKHLRWHQMLPKSPVTCRWEMCSFTLSHRYGDKMQQSMRHACCSGEHMANVL